LSQPRSVCAAILLLALPMSGLADQTSDVAALEARCEADREAKIKPLREKEIANCVANRSDLDYCQTFWKDYGNPVRLPNGRMTPRLFDDLPSCIAALKARQELEDSRR
jgi:hypothetical protein